MHRAWRAVRAKNRRDHVLVKAGYAGMKSDAGGATGHRHSTLLMTDAGVASIASWIIHQLADAGRLLLLTDYDGTLTPIVPMPDDAWLPRSVRADLEALARSRRAHVGIVSGRDLADLKKRVALPDAIYGGCHGLQIEGPGMRFRHRGAVAKHETLGAMSLELSARARAVPGMYVESKRLGVAVHYRQVAPNHVKHVEMEVARILEEVGSGFTCFHGAKVIEIQPRVNWTKGDCVQWIGDRVGGTLGDPTEQVLCIGDDWTDEHMFEALTGQAITIRVANHVPASHATHRLPDVASVQRLLALLAMWAKDSR